MYLGPSNLLEALGLYDYAVTGEYFINNKQKV